MSVPEFLRVQNIWWNILWPSVKSLFHNQWWDETEHYYTNYTNIIQITGYLSCCLSCWFMFQYSASPGHVDNVGFLLLIFATFLPAPLFCSVSLDQYKSLMNLLQRTSTLSLIVTSSSSLGQLLLWTLEEMPMKFEFLGPITQNYNQSTCSAAGVKGWPDSVHGLVKVWKLGGAQSHFSKCGSHWDWVEICFPGFPPGNHLAQFEKGSGTCIGK